MGLFSSEWFITYLGLDSDFRKRVQDGYNLQTVFSVEAFKYAFRLTPTQAHRTYTASLHSYIYRLVRGGLLLGGGALEPFPKLHQ